jgi:hypothetical protein
MYDTKVAYYRTYSYTKWYRVTFAAAPRQPLYMYQPIFALRPTIGVGRFENTIFLRIKVRIA